MRIEAHDGTAIYFDPFQLAEEPHDASVALITHDHYDHFSPEDVAKVANERTVFVAPATCAEGVRDKLGLGEGRVIAARPGERLDVAPPRASRSRRQRWCPRPPWPSEAVPRLQRAA